MLPQLYFDDLNARVTGASLGRRTHVFLVFAAATVALIFHRGICRGHLHESCNQFHADCILLSRVAVRRESELDLLFSLADE